MSILHLIIAIFIYIFNMVDYAFTKYWVDKYGLDSESNPIGRWMLVKPWRVIIFKFIVPFIALAVLVYFSNYLIVQIALYVILGIYFIVDIYHLIIAIKLLVDSRKEKK